MKIYILEDKWVYSQGDYTLAPVRVSEELDVTPEEYELIKQVYLVEISLTKDYVLEEAERKLREAVLARQKEEERRAAYEAKKEEREKKRKLKQLEKLQKELLLNE